MHWSHVWDAECMQLLQVGGQECRKQGSRASLQLLSRIAIKEDGAKSCGRLGLEFSYGRRQASYAIRQTLISPNPIISTYTTSLDGVR